MSGHTLRSSALLYGVLSVFGLLGVGQGQVIEGGVPLENDSVIALPAPQLRGELSVEEALHTRRSVREYADSALSLAEVSQVLWAAYGITMPIPDGPGFLRGGLKTAPSAGALYPLEVYVVAGHVGGLDAGVYRYKPEAHELHMVVRGDVRDELCRAAWDQDMVKRAPASIVASRTAWTVSGLLREMRAPNFPWPRQR